MSVQTTQNAITRLNKEIANLESQIRVNFNENGNPIEFYF